MRAAEAAEEVGGLGGGLQGARGDRGGAEARAKATEVAVALITIRFIVNITTQAVT